MATAPPSTACPSPSRRARSSASSARTAPARRRPSRSIVGLRTPDSGTIRVLGLDPRRDRDRLRAVVGVQLQESELPDRMTVREALELFASFYDDPATRAG